MPVFISGGQQVAPVSYADATPTLGLTNYYPGTGLSLSNAFASYSAIYETQLWAATLVNKIAFAHARLPLKVYERDSNGDRNEARDSPYAKLLRNPNARHDPFFFWLWTISTLEVYGEAMWVKERPGVGRPPSALYPLHPANVFTRRDKDTGELIYSYHLGSATTAVLEWPASEVVHFKGYNPRNQVRGMSRLEPLRQTILNEDAARRASASFWGNGARPSTVLSHPGTLTQPAIDRLKGQMDSIHAGVDNWGKSMVLEEGMTPHFVPLNAEEMQYIESRKMNREEFCAIYDVPPPVVHILDRATFSNITEQMRSMYRDTMAPRIGLVESVLDTQLRPDFDPRGTSYAEFLMDEVMRGAFEERSVSNQAAINSGQRTPNEIRKLDNLPALPGGDKLYINAASIPLETAAAAPPTGTSVEIVPQKVKSLALACAACGSEGSLSNRGLCRSCEGKSARILSARKGV